jgi:hypothetical protein
MTLLEDITSGKYKNYLIAIIFVIIFLIVTKKKEDFTETASLTTQQRADARQLIYETYKTDVDAIKNLSKIATQLQNGGLTYPGDFKVQGKLNIDNGTTCNKLTANNDTILNKLTANGDTILNKLTANGDTTLNKLTANGDTTLNKLTANGDIIGNNVKLNKLQFNQVSLNNDLLFDLLNTQTGILPSPNAPGTAIHAPPKYYCPNPVPSTWTRTYTITFPIPYKTRIPKVLLSLYEADIESDRNLRYEFKNVNVTLTTLSFDMFIWCNTLFTSYSIGWVAKA